MRSLSPLLLISAAWLCASTHATPKLEMKRIAQSSTLQFNTSFTLLKNADSQSIKGLTGGVGFIYGVNPHFGIVAKLEQAFSPASGFSTIYSLIELGGSFAVLGSLSRIREELYLDGSQVLDSTSATSSRVRLEIYANQYFLNASNGALGLAGVGLAAHYDQVLTKEVEVSIGIKFSIASNSGTVIYPLQILAGVLLPL